jgi:BolA protein
MGPLEGIIYEKLSTAFAPEFLEVTNESYMHSVPEGSESHFKLVVVSEQFLSMRSVARHQAIYSLLADELAGPVHALALHTYTALEWSEKQHQAPDSPNCLGGSKLS